MKNLNIALRSLFKKGRSNGIKILSLGVGLAMGLVLISKVCFERSLISFIRTATVFIGCTKTSSGMVNISPTGR